MGQVANAITKITFVKLGPTIAIKIIIKIKLGTLIKPSVMRIRIVSAHLPKKPEIRPTVIPMDNATATAPTPTIIEVRAPKATRAQTSRPTSSVPRRCPFPGGCLTLSKSIYSGPCGAIMSAKIAIRVTKARITTPTIASR